MSKSAIAIESAGVKTTQSSGLEPMPPVVVLNLFHSGLGIVRQLSRTGVRVVGLSAHPYIYGNFTRLCQVCVAPNSQEQPEQLAERLLQLAPELNGAVIFPTRDADVLFLDRFRHDLERFYKLAIPAPQALFRVIDKAALVQTAIEAGTPAPRTTVVNDWAQLQLAATTVGFPCVVKPVSSVHWRQGNDWKAVGGRKAFRANNLSELRNIYSRVSSVRSEILLQEWIPGKTDQIVVWGGYLGQGSEPLAYFTARKIVQSPDDFGTGCIVETDYLPELLVPSLRLCRALGYEGIAEIEYKRDVRDGTLKLIEINARHWDWHQLGDASQINLTWVAYCHLTGRSVSPLRPSVRRAKWIAEDSFLTHALAGLYRGEWPPLEIWRAFSGQRMYSIFAREDLRPFLRYSVAAMLPALARAAIQKVRDAVLKQ